MGRLKIGVLIPKSDMYPTLGLDLLNGLKLAFSKAEAIQESPSFIVENIGVAADDQVLKSAEKLILQENVDLTIAFCGILKLSELARLQEQYRRPLVNLDMGGRIYNSKHTNPYILHHTLNFWQSSYAAGRYAAENFGKRCIVAASFYDGAYHMMEAFNRGFTSKNGEISRYFVSNADYKLESFEGLIESIREEKPDFVYGIFSYNEGVNFMKSFANSEFNGKIPVIGVPALTDESIVLEDCGIEGIKTVASWSFDDTNPEMKSFISEYESQYDSVVNVISLLGYEAGLIINECLDSEGKVFAELKESVGGKTWNTPRGMLRINSFNESQVEEFKVRSFNFNEVKYHNKVIESIDSTFTESLQEEMKDVPVHGWLNPYLCT